MIGIHGWLIGMWHQRSVLASTNEKIITHISNFRKVKNIPDISKILIPYKSVPELLRVLEVISDTVRITYTRNQILLKKTIDNF